MQYKYMAATRGIAFCLAHSIQAQAAPLISFDKINMQVVSSTHQVTITDTSSSLMNIFQAGSLLCDIDVQDFTAIGPKQTCGTGNSNLATLYTIDYYFDSATTANFQLGSDWGRGGIIMGNDGIDILKTDNIWWAKNWNHGDVIDFSVSGSGHGQFQMLGFENCCAGYNSLRVSMDGVQSYSAIMQTVPEPLPFTLLGLGLAGLVIARKRKS